jgi:hypothetical protein
VRVSSGDVNEFFVDGEEFDDDDDDPAITTVTASEKRGSTITCAVSSNNLSSSAAASININKSKMNQLPSAIESASEQTWNAFHSYP